MIPIRMLSVITDSCLCCHVQAAGTSALDFDLRIPRRERRTNSAGSTRGHIGSKLRPVNRRPATGRSFFIMIAIACIATALVVAWTVRSSEGRRGGPGPTRFRM